jgi:hypothetical protein
VAHHRGAQGRLMQGSPNVLFGDETQRAPLEVFPLENVRLESTFALDQLSGLARFHEDREFVAWLVVNFGTDIPLSAYRMLRGALLDKSFENPPIKILATSIRGADAAYFRTKNWILVSRKLAEDARDDDKFAWDLLVALVEEFGHHVDWMLRNVYSRVGGDAPGDEGANYAFAAISLKYDIATEAQFAILLGSGGTTALKVDLSGIHDALAELREEADARPDDVDGPLEYFSAGRGPPGAFGHESLEDILADEGFSDEDRHQVYFGNWLRDYSQVCDPRLVRPPSSKTIVDGISRSALTQIVDVLTEAKFGRSGDIYRVTEERLGVYRPHEHIDNPLGTTAAVTASGVLRDPAFRPAYLCDEGDLDLTLGMKKYIRTAGNWLNSFEYIKAELAAAAQTRNPEGFRRLGQALHTLEDYFAHSNFSEVSLIKLGHKVYPGVEAGVAVRSPWEIPIVTGTFGSLDTAASILFEIADHLVKATALDSRERTTSTKVLLILLRDVDPWWGQKTEEMLSLYEKSAETVDQWLRKHSKVYPIFRATLKKIVDWWHLKIGEVIKKMGDAMEHAQTQSALGRLPTDPSHTQLAKDHGEHPLHGLAIALARVAVKHTAHKIVRAWNRKEPPSNAALTASRFIVHPTHSAWMNKTVSKWAKANPSLVVSAQYRDKIEEFQVAHWKSLMNRVRAKIRYFDALYRYLETLFGKLPSY